MRYCALCGGSTHIFLRLSSTVFSQPGIILLFCTFTCFIIIIFALHTCMRILELCSLPRFSSTSLKNSIPRNEQLWRKNVDAFRVNRTTNKIQMFHQCWSNYSLLYFTNCQLFVSLLFLSVICNLVLETLLNVESASLIVLRDCTKLAKQPQYLKSL